MVDDLLKIAKDWGIFAALCFVFIFWSQRDKAELVKRLDEQTGFIRTEFMQALGRNSTALEIFARRIEEDRVQRTAHAPGP